MHSTGNIFNFLQSMLFPSNSSLRKNSGIYKKCAEYALARGIIIADTKFEFGLDEEGNIVLADEMLTPDSSRFWPVEGYEPGHGQPSFDKQFARDWLKERTLHIFYRA